MDAAPDCAKDPKSPVTIMKLVAMVAAEAKKSFLRPRLSTLKAAPTAKIRFHICRQAEIMSWLVALLAPTVSRTRAK